MVSFDDPVQQEVWRTLRALNDAWTKGDPDTLDQFFHSDMIAITPTDRHRLDGREACLRGWKEFCAKARILRWREVDPVVRLYGDAAVVAYDFDMAIEIGGQEIGLSGRDMLFFAKQDGRWWAVADQFSPYPGAAA